MKDLVSVRWKINDAHVQQIVPSLRIINIFKFFMALFKQGQTIVVVNIRNQHIVNELIVKFHHAKVIGCPQHFNYNFILINIRFQKADILSLEIFLDQKVGLLCNPLRKRKGELDSRLRTSLLVFICLFSDSLMRSSRLSRKTWF